MMIELLRRDGYDVDDAKNLLPMPGEAKDRLANPNLIGHQGSHGRYNNTVRDALLRERTRLIQKYKSLDKVPTKELQDAAKGVQSDMHDMIINRDPRIPTRHDPATGTQILSEKTPDTGDMDFAV
jgi:hypothetical protein